MKKFFVNFTNSKLNPIVCGIKVVCSVSLTSAGNNWDCDKRFAFYFSLHDMFRRLAPCSRGGFYKNDKLSNIQQTKYLCPQEKWEWGQRFTKIPEFKKSWPQRGFSSLGQSGRLSPPPLLLTASAHWRFCLSGTCTKTAYYLYVYFVIVVFKLHFQFQTSRHIVHIRYMLIRSFLIQRPSKCLKCLSFDIWPAGITRHAGPQSMTQLGIWPAWQVQKSILH